jgi:Mor family transcriptional regulator
MTKNHGQKGGLKISKERGSMFYRGINTHGKLSPKKIENMLRDFDNRTHDGSTVVSIAKKYGVNKAAVYYHVKMRFFKN